MSKDHDCDLTPIGDGECLDCGSLSLIPNTCKDFEEIEKGQAIYYKMLKNERDNEMVHLFNFGHPLEHDKPEDNDT